MRMRWDHLKYSSPVNIVLLHKNLRISDNSALYHGCKSDKSLVIYAYDKGYWSNNGRSERQFQFCLDCLGELDEKLNKLNRDLFIFEGDLKELSFKISVIMNVGWLIQKNFRLRKVFVYPQSKFIKIAFKDEQISIEFIKLFI